MADIKFACPHCQQHIQAEPGYAGLQITCPACSGSLMVPGSQVTAVPVPVPVQASAPAPAPAIARAAAPAYAAPPATTTSSGCPSCGGALPRGAALCTQCGYNVVTGQRTVAGRPAALGKPTSPNYETRWYQTPYPYLAVVVMVLAVLYFLGKQNPPMMLVFIGTALLYVFVAHIMVVVAAFRESVGTGFLALCIPLYALYFVFKVSDNDSLKIIYAGAILVNISLRFLLK